MNWMNLLGLIYFGAHLEAGIFGLILWGAVVNVRQIGAAAWVIPAVCLWLAVSDWTGRIPVSGPFGKLAAALLFPPICGMADVLVRDRPADSTPVMWGYVLSLLLLAGYVLLREPDSGEPPDRAAALLELGRSIAVVEIMWLHLVWIVGLLIMVFGFMLALLIGALLAAQNGLLDYSGIRGWLLGLLALHLFQSVLFLRGARLARKADPTLGGGPLPALFIPVWNLIQAGRLANRLHLRKWTEEGYSRY